MIMHCPYCDSDLRLRFAKQDIINNEMTESFTCYSALCPISIVTIIRVIDLRW